METDMVMLKVYTMRSMNTTLAMTTHLHKESQIIYISNMFLPILSITHPTITNAVFSELVKTFISG